MKAAVVGIVLALTMSLVASTVHGGVMGPLGGSGLNGEYARFTDSPFSGLPFSDFYLEDFEDALLNVPGVSANNGGVTSVVFGAAFHDSVDTDDGVLDGSGLNGDDFFSSSGSAGITFTFDPVVLGGLPTHAGLVWTDGGGRITFEAFDNNGDSLGTQIGDHADQTFNGTTLDDRFYGATNPAGVSAIHISNATGGIEIDHLQYGFLESGPNVVPEPSSILIFAIGLLGFLGCRAYRPFRVTTAAP